VVLDTSDEWIRRKSGVIRRHIAAPGMATSILLTLAHGRNARNCAQATTWRSHRVWRRAHMRFGRAALARNCVREVNLRKDIQVYGSDAACASRIGCNIRIAPRSCHPDVTVMLAEVKDALCRVG
jgi:hypothetical protein